MLDINYLAVLVAAIAAVVLGGIWYGPVFGKLWITLMGWTPKEIEEAKKKGMGKSYALTALGALVMAYVLAHFVVGWAMATIAQSAVFIGLQTGFWLWLGIVLPVLLSSVLWEKKSWKLYLLNVGYWLAVLLTMGAILGGWYAA